MERGRTLRRLALGTGAFLWVVIATVAAWATTQVTMRSGIWEAFGGTTVTGRPVCGMSSEVNKQYVGVKHFSGDDTVTIQLGTGQWRVTNGTKYRVEMQIDTGRVWHADATGMHFNDGDAGLEYTIHREELDEFLTELRDGNVLTLLFPDGGMTSWRVSLTGAGVVSSAFRSCEHKLVGR